MISTIAFWRDLRYARRILSANRLVSFLIILSLASAIGSTTAVFSFANTVLFRPLPYRDADQLVLLWASKTETVTRGISGPDLSDLREQNHVFEDLVPFVGGTGEPVSLGAENARTVSGFHVGTGLFHLLGSRPFLGRTFRSEEDEPGEDKVAVISYSLWRSEFGGDRNLVGRRVILDNEPYTVIGVMPEDFFFPDQRVQVWLPILSSQIAKQRGSAMVHAIARLRAQVTLEEARTEVDTIVQSLTAAYPDTDKQLSIGVFRLADQILGSYRMAFWALLGGMMLLLLIACANVAHLLLVRGAGRGTEISIRVAFGATRGAIFRQLLTESLLLSVAGGFLGILIAYWSVHFLRGFGLTDIPRFGEARVNGAVLLFALIISLLTGILFGLLPAMRSSRPNLMESLKQGGTAYSYRERSHLRDFLIVSEIALAFVLMASAGLLINSFVRLARLDWGFRPDHLLVVDTELPRDYWTSVAESSAFGDQVISRMTALPGVLSVGVACGSPLRNWSWKPRDVILDGREKIETREWLVGPGYFRTLGIHLLRGRGFVESDDTGNSKVVVIERELAERLWPGQDPVGKTLFVLSPKKEVWEEFLKLWRSGKREESTRLLNDSKVFDRVPLEVIGEVGPTLMFGPSAVDSDASIYMDYRQRLTDESMQLESFFLRTSIEPSTLANTVHEIIAQTGNGAVTIKTIDTMEQRFVQTIGGRGSNKLLLLIASITSVLGLLLAALGIYGMLAYAVTVRTREIGVRMALGAHRGEILGMVLGRGLLVSIAGVLFGVAFSILFTKMLATYLFGVKPTDSGTFAGAGVLFIFVALIASYFPGRRATKVDPLTALRHE